MPLTDAKIRSLKPKGKPYKVSDYDSLFILVSAKGSKLWKFKYRFNKKENRLSFGKYPYVTLQQARQLRDDARALLEKGIDPAAERKKDKEEVLAQSLKTKSQEHQKFKIQAYKAKALSFLSPLRINNKSCKDLTSLSLTKIVQVYHLKQI